MVANVEREHFLFLEFQFFRETAFRTEVDDPIGCYTGTFSIAGGGDFGTFYYINIRNFRVVRLSEENFVLFHRPERDDQQDREEDCRRRQHFLNAVL